MRISRFKALNIFNGLLLIIALIQYFLLTPLNTPSETYLTTFLKFDISLKLIPGFMIPYMSVYILLIFLLVKIVREKNNFDMVVFLMSIVLLWSTVNLAHGLIPTMSIRPEIINEGLFFQLLNDLYKSVPPFRTMPSWHAATAALCAIAYIRMDFRKRIPVIAWCLLICISPIFIKMAYLLDVIVAIPLAFLSFTLAQKISTIKMRTESVQEIVKSFSIESLIQSVAIGIRNDRTLHSLIEGLTRIEKNLTERDKESIRSVGAVLNPPVENLKQVINNLTSSVIPQSQVEKAREMFGNGEKSYIPTEKELKQATGELAGKACIPFENSKFRAAIIEIKENNAGLMNNTSLEDAAMERSRDIIFRFNSFLESHKKSLPALKFIDENTNGHHKISFREIKGISRELRKPPYEITLDEIWNAYHRIDSESVKPIGLQKSPANIISLTQYALGKSESLEPYSDKVDRKFNEWIESNKAAGKIYIPEEVDWLVMMKNYYATFLELNMASFDQPPFVNRGGSSKAYTIFGHDLNRILYELNEKLN